LTENQITLLKRERDKLIDAWRQASIGNKSSILVRIADIDDELEKYQTKKSSQKRKKSKKYSLKKYFL